MTPKALSREWKTIDKQIFIRQDTLNTYDKYVDFIHLNDEKISIRLTVSKEDYPLLVDVKNISGIGLIKEHEKQLEI